MITVNALQTAAREEQTLARLLSKQSILQQADKSSQLEEPVLQQDRAVYVTLHSPPSQVWGALFVH